MLAGAPAAGGAVSLAVHEDLAGILLARYHAELAPAPPRRATRTTASRCRGRSPSRSRQRGCRRQRRCGAPTARSSSTVWTFLAGHPTRPEIAADEEAFKALLRALTPSELKLAEKVEFNDILRSAFRRGDLRWPMENSAFSAATAAPGRKAWPNIPSRSMGFSMPAGSAALPACADERSRPSTSFNLGIDGRAASTPTRAPRRRSTTCISPATDR